MEELDDVDCGRESLLLTNMSSSSTLEELWYPRLGLYIRRTL